jgi:uncharacterized membrane protein YdjX (TVP38/TMEM64 family)
MLEEQSKWRGRQIARRAIAVAFLSTVISLVGWSYFDNGLAATLVSSDVSAEAKVDTIQAYFDRWGALAPLVYVLVVTVEVVVAPIPGTLLYLPGGIIFGGLLGGTLALIGNVLGAGLSCQIMRTLVGTSAMESFARNEKLMGYQRIIEQRGLLVIVLLRINPLTSSDLVSYAAGVTRISTKTVMLGTLIGMAPLCYAQAFTAMTLVQAFPWLIWPLVVACVVYAGVVFWLLWNVRRTRTS